MMNTKTEFETIEEKDKIKSMMIDSKVVLPLNQLEKRDKEHKGAPVEAKLSSVKTVVEDAEGKIQQDFRDWLSISNEGTPFSNIYHTPKFLPTEYKSPEEIKSIFKEPKSTIEFFENLSQGEDRAVAYRIQGYEVSFISYQNNLSVGVTKSGKLDSHVSGLENKPYHLDIGYWSLSNQGKPYSIKDYTKQVGIEGIFIPKDKRFYDMYAVLPMYEVIMPLMKMFCDSLDGDNPILYEGVWQDKYLRLLGVLSGIPNTDFGRY